MDSVDRKILSVLQNDCTGSLAELSAQVGLSPTPCWRRIQKMEEAGIIRRRVAVLAPEKIGLGLTVFVSLRTGNHHAAWLADFTRRVQRMDEVVEVNRLAGGWDYLLRVVVPDMAAYDTFYKRLIEIEGLSDVSSSFSMEQIKYTTALPLGHARID
jgi:Lrp/AsnC family transcriptional regulator